MKFHTLLSVLSKVLPPHKMTQISKYHCDFHVSTVFYFKTEIIFCEFALFCPYFRNMLVSEEKNYEAATGKKIKTDSWRRDVNQSDQTLQN